MGVGKLGTSDFIEFVEVCLLMDFEEMSARSASGKWLELETSMVFLLGRLEVGEDFSVEATIAEDGCLFFFLRDEVGGDRGAARPGVSCPADLLSFENLILSSPAKRKTNNHPLRSLPQQK